jgi:NhaP-type Na+/H+ or K+/H+ antiporter
VVVVVVFAASFVGVSGMMAVAVVGFLRNFALNLNMFDASC